MIRLPKFNFSPGRARGAFDPVSGQDQTAYRTPVESMGDRYMYNTRYPSNFTPPNEGGPGNPGTANNMSKYPTPQFQNNKGPAGPPVGATDVPQLPMPDNWTRNPQLPMQDNWYNPRGGGYNGGGINPGGRPPFPQFDPRMRARQGMFGPPQQQGGDPFNQYGFAGQSPQLGRYIPPMMREGNQDNWMGGGGYSYNIPNSYGSNQWNQFNSTDMANPQFGQRPWTSGELRTGVPGTGSPMPQFSRPDFGASQNYQNFMMSLAMGQQPQNQQGNVTQPGAPTQPVSPY